MQLHVKSSVNNDLFITCSLGQASIGFGAVKTHLQGNDSLPGVAQVNQGTMDNFGHNLRFNTGKFSFYIAYLEASVSPEHQVNETMDQALLHP